MAPNDIRINLDHYSNEVMPEPDQTSIKITDSYMVLTYKAVYDFADYYMCSAALLQFTESQIFTVDRTDLSNALSDASKVFANDKKKFCQLIQFK